MSNRNLSKNQRFSLGIILLSLMLILSYIEVLLPITFGGFGIKIGLSNIMTIIGIKLLGIKPTIILNILRLVILGILFGNIIRFAISVSGFIMSFVVLVLCIDKLKFNIVASSIFGATFHNIGQIVAIMIITRNASVAALIPIYIIIGIFTGAIIGFITELIYTKIMLIIFD